MALKQYDENELIDVLEGIKNERNFQLYPHSVFVFSSEWGEKEVGELWNRFVTDINRDIIFYRIVNDNLGRKNQLALVSLFSKSIKNSHVFLSAEEWLTANYITSKWRKSIWTYEYILNLYDFLSSNYNRLYFKNEVRT